jgi:hypothetical protein
MVSAAHAAPSFHFESDLEGWTAVNAAISWAPEQGGSDGGYLEFTDAAGLSEIIAPASWTGDLSQYTGIRFDIRRLAPVTDPAEPALSVDFITIVGATGTAKAYFTAVPTQWTSYTAAFDDLWFPDGGEDLPSILTNVTEIRFSLDLYGMTPEAYGIDNIALVPSAGGYTLFAIGGAWGVRRRRR